LTKRNRFRWNDDTLIMYKSTIFTLNEEINLCSFTEREETDEDFQARIAELEKQKVKQTGKKPPLV
jgi:hypothetical protein